MYANFLFHFHYSCMIIFPSNLFTKFTQHHNTTASARTKKRVCKNFVTLFTLLSEILLLVNNVKIQTLK